MGGVKMKPNPDPTWASTLTRISAHAYPRQPYPPWATHAYQLMLVLGSHTHHGPPMLVNSCSSTHADRRQPYPSWATHAHQLMLILGSHTYHRPPTLVHTWSTNRMPMSNSIPNPNPNSNSESMTMVTVIQAQITMQIRNPNLTIQFT